MNTIFLGGDNGYDHGTEFAGSQAETAWNLALSAGVERIILHDAQISNLAQHTNGKVVGADGTYKTYEELVAKMEEYLSVYCNKEGFYGIRLGDEPALSKAENFGYVYKAVKQAAKNLGKDDIYILLNLLPLESAALGSFAESGDADIRASYKKYIETFIEAADADEICVDSYPFKPDGTAGGERVLTGHYVSMQVLAEVCEEHGVSACFIVQSFEMVYTKGNSANGYMRIDNANDMCMQIASLLGFGIEDFAFYTYMTCDVTGTSYSATDGSSFITSTGATTDIYDYAKGAIANAKAVYALLNDFDYGGSKMLVSSSASAYGSVYTSTYSYSNTDSGISVGAGSFDNSYSFKDLVSVSNDNSIMLVTELTGSVSNVYMFQNVLSDHYATALGTKTMKVTAQFDPAYEKALVYAFNADGTVGTWQTVKLTDGVFTADIANGLAVYVMPYNW